MRLLLGPRRSLVRSYRSRSGDMELSLEDKTDLKRVGSSCLRHGRPLAGSSYRPWAETAPARKGDRARAITNGSGTAALAAPMQERQWRPQE
ncbi:hypothetical protein GW17_00054576 [Ensete ventricosum]|nr:hypothetical protein GW17_00054576 [Ensete ventricosum]